MNPSFLFSGIARRELILLIACASLALLAVFGPALVQPAHQHDFADQRIWLGVPHALDVWSNLPFALAGGLGLFVLFFKRKVPLTQANTAAAALFFIALIATAAGSAYYHWAPSDATLLVDRGAMVLAFAGLMGLAAADRISDRAAWALTALVLAAGAASLTHWAQTGNVLAWGVVQLGGMAVLGWLALCKRVPGALAVRWGVVLGLYAVAKGLELGDHAVYEFTQGWVSGHNAKHVVASCAAWPVVAALLGTGHSVPKLTQNRLHTANSTRPHAVIR